MNHFFAETKEKNNFLLEPETSDLKRQVLRGEGYDIWLQNGEMKGREDKNGT